MVFLETQNKVEERLNMIYEYILLDEERIAKEETEVTATDLYKIIESVANDHNMKKSKGAYKREKGIWVKSDDSVNEFRNSFGFFGILTLEDLVMQYVKKWSMVHNLENKLGPFHEDDVLASIKKFEHL